MYSTSKLYSSIHCTDFLVAFNRYRIPKYDVDIYNEEGRDESASSSGVSVRVYKTAALKRNYSISYSNVRLVQ